MSIILPQKTFEVFGKSVTFTAKELINYRNDGLEIPDGSILEFFLLDAGLKEQFLTAPQSVIKKMCETAIQRYGKVCETAAEAMIKNGDI